MIMRHACLLAIAACVAACNSQTSEEPAAQASVPATEETSAAGASTTPADAGAQADAVSPAATEGQLMVVTRTTECAEVGPDASDYPWTMGKGSHVKFIAAQGDKTKVADPTGAPCLIDSDAIAPE